MRKCLIGILLLLGWLGIIRAGDDNLRFLGHNEVNRNHEMDCEVVGNRAFIANGYSQGLEMYDISNPASPGRTWLNNGPNCWRIVAAGDTLLFVFARRDGVILYDISGSGDPVRLGQYDPTGNLEALEGGAAIGETLYCAAHQNGVYAVDISNPASPQPVGTLTLTPGSAAWNAIARDSFLLVANGRFGLAVVGTKGGLHQVASLSLPGLANDIVLDGDIAAIALGAAGLATVAVSNPRTPVLRGVIGTDGCVWGSGVFGHLVISGSWRVMELFDIADPDRIVRRGWDNTYVWAHGADIRADSTIGVADWRGMSCYKVGPDLGPDIDVVPEQLDFGAVTVTSPQRHNPEFTTKTQRHQENPGPESNTKPALERPDEILRFAQNDGSEGTQRHQESLLCLSALVVRSARAFVVDSASCLSGREGLPVSFSRDTGIVVRNTGSGRLDVTSVNGPSGITVNPNVFSVAPGDSRIVTVTAAGSGQTNGSIRFNCNDPDESLRTIEVYKNDTAYPQYGSIAPDFTLAGTDGQTHTLSDCRGKVVYLEFGASW
jgi:hypothetical protein